MAGTHHTELYIAFFMHSLNKYLLSDYYITKRTKTVLNMRPDLVLTELKGQF